MNTLIAEIFLAYKDRVTQISQMPSAKLLIERRKGGAGMNKFNIGWVCPNKHEDTASLWQMKVIAWERRPTFSYGSQALFSSLYTSTCVIRHTRREAGIQCHGRRVQIHPCSLDSGNPCRNDGL